MKNETIEAIKNTFSGHIRTIIIQAYNNTNSLKFWKKEAIAEALKKIENSNEPGLEKAVAVLKSYL